MKCQKGLNHKIESKSQNFLKQKQNSNDFPDLLTTFTKVCPTHFYGPVYHIYQVILEYMIKTSVMKVGASSCLILDSYLVYTSTTVSGLSRKGFDINSWKYSVC